MNSLIELVESQLGNDYFIGAATAGMLTVITGALMYLVKDIPLRVINFLWSRIRRRLVYIVSIDDYNSLYYHVALYLYNNNNNSFRNVEALMEDGHVYKSSRDGSVFRPGSFNSRFYKYGKLLYRQRNDIHWIWWNKKPIIVNKSREKLEGAREAVESYKEYYVLSSWFGKPHINSFLKHIEKEAEKNKEKEEFIPKYFYLDPRGNFWDVAGNIAKRPFDTIYYKNLDKIINEIEFFLNRKEIYNKYGRPYKKGLLFEGVPRTGKTSIVKALANYFKRDIYYLDLKSVRSDNELISCFNDVNAKQAILLIEDIDSYFDGRESKDGVEVTFSGLLQLLDGINSSEGLITIITTNKVESIKDNALLGSGRIESHYHFPKPTKEDIYNYIIKVLSEDEPDLKDIQMSGLRDDINISELQQLFVDSNNINDFIKQITK